MITGTLGKRAATLASASGSPSRRLNGEASPSLLRTPTVSTPQWTNTAAPRAAAASNVALTRSSVELVVVHRREQADGSQVPVVERARQPLRGVVRRGIQHEEADQPRRMPGNRRGDRLLVAGDAGDQGGAGDVMLVELRDPAIGQRIGRARRLPAEQRGHDRRMITGRDVAPIPGQDLEKPRREEMTVDVADLHGRILDRGTRAVESESAARDQRTARMIRREPPST